jgi:steroid delta-isomerase-like uncharacterized protein
MTEENKAVVKRELEEIWNKGNLAAIEECYAPDGVFSGDQLPDSKGIEAIGQLATMIHSSFPDIHYTVGDLIAEGDKVVLRWTSRGTHRGEFLGIAPTEKQIKSTGTTTYCLEGGKIVEAWVNWDALGMMQQLGVATLPVSK